MALYTKTFQQRFWIWQKLIIEGAGSIPAPHRPIFFSTQGFLEDLK